MSVTRAIHSHMQRIPRGKPFTNAPLLNLGSRTAVDKALSRGVKKGVIQRVTRGVFVRPKKSQWVSEVAPDMVQVLAVIAKKYHETIQVHGAEAARRFKLTTQVPVQSVFYTSGPTRTIRVGKLTIKLVHTSRRKLLYAGKKVGLARLALWYLGKAHVNNAVIHRVREGLSAQEFEQLQSMDMPAWMSKALIKYSEAPDV